MNKKPAFDEILDDVRSSDLKGAELRQFAMERLDHLPTYDWSGVYILKGDTLHLDAYVGEATDHTEIPVGRGVCGTAVATGENQLVPDVRRLENYLSCSIHTRSEIVTLIRRDGKIVGQIDIDSHEVEAFDRQDEAFLDEMGRILAGRWED
jgi:GAF domain-containing protein